MSEYALRLENGTDTAPRVRQGDSLSLRHAGVLNARGGVRNDGGGVVTAVAGTMQVQVAPVMAWVDGGSSSTQGGYPFVLDAAKNLTLSDGHATLARVDTIAIVVRENAYDGGGVTSAAVEVVQGTPGSGAPSLPASCVPLRDVNVPAGLSAGTGGLSSGNLSTDRRKYLATGGQVRVASATERDALSVQHGDEVWRSDTKRSEVYDGSGWVDPLQYRQRMLSGSHTFAISATGTDYIAAIAFPAGVFTNAPTVVVSIKDPASNAPQNFAAGCRVVTASGFDLIGCRTAGASPTLEVTWVAVSTD